MAHIPETLRRFVTERAGGRCEYCQTDQRIVVAMVIDHIVPTMAGGPTTADNLCLSCVGCNLYKSDFQDGIDPDTQEPAVLFNPRLEIWQDHFNWEPDGAILRGLTPIGRSTIVRLRINRPEAVQSRRLWVQAGWHPPHT